MSHGSECAARHLDHTRDALHDESFYEKRLKHASKRVFSREESFVEVIAQKISEGKYPITTTTTVTNVTELQRVLANRGQCTVIILRQYNTWSHLRADFKLIMSFIETLDVFSPFLDILLAFGSRTDDVGDDFQGYNHAVRSQTVGEEKSIIEETCFNIRFPERNGRKNGQSWSIRHSAVYHQYQSFERNHVWIIVQPSETYYSQIQRIFRVPSCNGHAEHALSDACFLSTGRFWRDYMESLQRPMLLLENRALFSKTPITAKPNLQVSFQNSQDAQRLRKKYMIDHGCCGSCEFVIKGCLFQLHAHTRVASKVLQQMDGVFRILLEILKCRNDDAIRTTTDAIHDNGCQISKLISALSAQDRVLAGLTQKAQQDSNMVKIFSIVAFIYLPATLVASVFNSSLVDTVPVGKSIEPRSQTAFQIASQFWMFPVYAIALTILSLLFMMPWIVRREGRTGVPLEGVLS